MGMLVPLRVTHGIKTEAVSTCKCLFAESAVGIVVVTA